MGHEDFHELTAAYALDSLDEQDELAYEEHLRTCPRCREDLAAAKDTAGLLAYGAAAQAPPPALRERILEQARSERADVIAHTRGLRRHEIGDRQVGLARPSQLLA